MGTKLDPQTKKITLVEFDYGQKQTLWFNYTAYVWYVDFDAIYDRIDPVYLVGVSSQPVTTIGSVTQDATALASQVSLANCISTASSYYWDQTERRLYIHLSGGDEPSIHTVSIGITNGVANQAATYNAVFYDSRLRSAPSISKSKDPLFFGRVSFDGGSIGIDNMDGLYDQISVSNLYGSEVRILQGFDSDAYAAFARMATGVIEKVEISETLMTLTMVDKRKALSRTLPLNTFAASVYPNMDTALAGTPIPLTYGALHGVPATCINDNESPMPSQYTFVVSDTSIYPIQSLDAVYVAGTLQGQNLIANPGAKSGTSSWSLAEGTGTFTVSTLSRTEGSQSFALTGTAGFCATEVSVIPGNAYIYTVRVRGSTAAGTGLYVNMNESTAYATGAFITAAAASAVQNMAANVAISTAWSLYSGRYTPGTAMVAVSFEVAKLTGGGTATTLFIDDVHLVPGFSAVSLASGTFGLPASVYTPRDEVVVDMHGYVTSAPYIIENAASVIFDLMNNYLGIPYNSANFNTSEWATATVQAKAVGLFIGDLTPIFEAIEDICASTLANLIQQDGGAYTLRIYDASRAVAQTFALDELMEVPSYVYDSSQVISSASVGYWKHWASGRYSRVHDTSHQSSVFTAYHLYREREFLTLLTNATDAQAVASAILSISATAMQTVKAAFKLQPLGDEIMDFITLPVWRPTKKMLGTTTMEVIEISKDLLAAKISLTGRVVSIAG